MKCACTESVALHGAEMCMSRLCGCPWCWNVYVFNLALHGAESLFWNADTGGLVAVHGPEICIVKEAILTANAELYLNTLTDLRFFSITALFDTAAYNLNNSKKGLLDWDRCQSVA